LKKKIVIINQYGKTPNEFGATKHYDMAAHFASKGDYNIELWVCGISHSTGQRTPELAGFLFQSSTQINNFKLTKINSIKYRNNSLLRQINHTIFDFITCIKILLSKNISIIILSVPPISNFNVWAMKFKNIKFIVDLEDLWPLFMVEMGMKNKIAQNYMDIFSKYTYRCSDAIAPVSLGMLEYVKLIVGINKKMWVAPLGVDFETYNRTVKDYNLIKTKEWIYDFKIMYVGAHGKANDLYSVLNTIKIINSEKKLFNNDQKLSFIFIGDGNEKKSLIKYAKNNKINNVFFEDPVPAYMVPSYLIHSDICLTNLKKIDSFKLVRPNKLFQYMALGKPIICGIWGEASSIIVNEAKSGIYVDFQNNICAAKEIIKLVQDDDKLKTYGINGINYIKNKGDRKNILEKYYINVKKIINGEIL